MEKEIKYKWNLADIYESDEKMYSDLEKCKVVTDVIEEFKGTLGDSSENIFNCYLKLEELNKIVIKVYGYSMLKHHQNMGDVNNLKMFKDVQNVQNDIDSRLSFILPEIVEISDETLISYLNENDNLKKYKRVIEKILKDKKHVLNKEAEYVISKYSEILNSMDDIYSMLSNVDFKFEDIYDSNNMLNELTLAKYSKYMSSKDRKLRENAFNTVHLEYKKYINTITEIYINSVKKDSITSKLKNYNSSIENAVYNDDASIEVYNSLLKSVNDNININYRYMNLKKKMLKMNELHLYDMYVNDLNEFDEEISYTESMDIIKKALSPLGNDYISVIDKAFSNRWIDVYESENKHNGAYSMGVYGVHPYILSNYTNDVESVSTIAHELGHTMHSYYSSMSQPYIYSNYTILVAEVASTVNEMLLSEYMINNENDNRKKAALINSQIDRIRATLIRQTMFAEFEKTVHDKVNENISLSSDDLCEIYLEINKKYFGENVVVDDNIQYEWARIPHFYSSFYVYKYATGISSAIYIANSILNKKEGYVEKYINMLKLGGSKDSLDILRSVDVDLETDTPVKEALKYYEKKIIQLEEILNQI